MSQWKKGVVSMIGIQLFSSAELVVQFSEIHAFSQDFQWTIEIPLPASPHCQNDIITRHRTQYAPILNYQYLSRSAEHSGSWSINSRA
ncbi:putative efflux pump mfs2 [Fusarium oxysporum f. sp. albedinis]|nr:putative efflux pump mfs2 [Fusarium oxysporum f. sp. albedinis]